MQPNAQFTDEPSDAALAAWFACEQGRYVLDWEAGALDAAVVDLFGAQALQIGLPQHDLLRANRMPQQFVLSADEVPHIVSDDAADASRATPSVVLGLAHELPFATQSLDLVLLPHGLEFVEDPHAVLREVERVLRPEGHVLVTGFNPVSLWGIKRQFGGATVPWSSAFIGNLRLRDWFNLLNFAPHKTEYGCYRPPVESDKWLGRFRWLEGLGARWWPFGGAVYMAHAVKKVEGMRIVGLKWKTAKPKLRFAPVAQRDAHKTSMK